MSLITNIYNNKKSYNRIIYAFVCAFSLLSSYLLRDNLFSNLALGHHTLLFFVPITLYSFYFMFVEDLNFILKKFVFFIFISFLPVYPYLNNEIVHIFNDDSWWFSYFANNMVENKTLAGNPEGTNYYKQPGFSYFLALEIFLLKETRFLQLINIIIFSGSIFYLLSLVNIKEKIENNKSLLIITFLSIPYAVKNILYVYSEWFAVLLVITASIFLIKKKYIFFFIFLSLIPFVRQNLAIAVLLLFSFVLVKIQIENVTTKLLYLLVFVFFLLLPVYHGLYYTGVPHFFVSDFGQSIYNDHLNESQKLTGIPTISWLINNFEVVFWVLKTKVLQIFLISPEQDFENKIISLFVPLSLVYMVFCFFKNKIFINKLFLFLIALTTFGPAFLLGGGSFPRFAFTNIYFCIISFCIIYFIDTRANEKNNFK